MQWFAPDTPELRAYSTWQRRRWGYLTAADDPEAQALCRRLEAWAVDPGRAYLRGADLRLVLVTLGVEWAHTSFLELRRLASLCAGLDVLAIEHPGLEVPPEVIWSVLGWQEHHPRRRQRVGAA